MPDYMIRGIDPELWKRFKSTCALNGVSIKKVLLTAVKDYSDRSVDRDTEVISPPSEETKSQVREEKTKKIATW
ncbi:MAG: hypothetical protein HN641_12645 [Candidatus Marinimicrobia bacterium]|jgi:hypothetical protein|nr:hypothetical protein [Candidatus Neomarinimicrobiota bacterium]MBT7884672.1 hypothetical protein [Candidatus Neomarinimicrobiota bacterium]